MRADDIRIPLYVSEEIQKVCDDLGIRLPRKAAITFVAIDDNISENGQLKYLDATGLIKAINSLKWPVNRIDTISELHTLYENGKLDSLFESPPAKVVKGDALDLLSVGCQLIKAGRLIKKLCPALDDWKVEEFSSHIIKGAAISIVDTVTKIYKIEPPHSCMTGRSMEFYEKNGVKVVIAHYQTKLVARALLWPSINFARYNKKLPLMDRVFDTDGRFAKLMDLFAQANSIVRRKGQQHFRFNEEDFEARIEFPLDEYNIEYVPFLDTMNYAIKNGKIVTLYNYHKEGAIGLLSGENPFNLPMVFSKYLNKELPKKHAMRLEYIDDWGTRDDCYCFESGNYLKKDCLACATCNDLFYIKDSRLHTSVLGEPICTKCGKEIQAGTYRGLYARERDILMVNKRRIYKNDEALVCTKVEPLLITDDGVYVDRLSYRKSLRVCINEQQHEENGSLKASIISGRWIEVEEEPVYHRDMVTGKLF